MVGQDLTAPGGTQIHVNVGQDSLLDVSDSNGLQMFNKNGLNNAPPQVDLERLLEVGFEGLRNGLFHFLLPLILETIKGQETRVFKLDQKAVVRSGLDADDRGQPETSLLVGLDLRDAKVYLGLIAEDKLTMRFPGIGVSGVADCSTNCKKIKGCMTIGNS